MTPAAAAVAVAALAALADLAAPAGAAPSGLRRLLRALPAGSLAVALRLADAPPLAAAALLSAGLADGLALDGREPGVGGWTASLLAQLLLAAALWELASPALLLAAPWRAAGATLVLAGGGALALAGRRPRGELAPLAPATVLLLAAAAAAAGAQPVAALAVPFAAAAALACAAAALDWARRPRSGSELGTGPAPGAGLGRPERALRSAAALALAWPLLPPPL